MESTEPKKLVVRRAKSQEEIQAFITEYFQLLGWVTGEMDYILDWVAGPDGAGVYVGELEGRLITGVTMIQHSDLYGYVSAYYCEEKYRGKGYGFKTFKVARAALNPQVNLALDTIVSSDPSQPSMAPLYETQGFKKAWVSPMLFVRVMSILEAFMNVLTPENVTIECAAKVDFTDLRRYVEDVMGLTFTHPGLLEKWISLPTHKAFIALKNGMIVGIATIRKCLHAVAKYRVGPLLANSGDIARLLLFKVAQEVNSDEQVSLHIACEINTEARKIVGEMKEKVHKYDLARMYTNGEPPIKKEKYFCGFSPNTVG